MLKWCNQKRHYSNPQCSDIDATTFAHCVCSYVWCQGSSLSLLWFWTEAFLLKKVFKNKTAINQWLGVEMHMWNTGALAGDVQPLVYNLKTLLQSCYFFCHFNYTRSNLLFPAICGSVAGISSVLAGIKRLLPCGWRRHVKIVGCSTQFWAPCYAIVELPFREKVHFFVANMWMGGHQPLVGAGPLAQDHHFRKG